MRLANPINLDRQMNQIANNRV